MSDKYYPDIENAPYGVARLGDKYTLLDIFEKFPKKKQEVNNYWTYIVAPAVIAASSMGAYNKAFLNRSFIYKPQYTILASIAFGAVGFISYYYREKAELRTEAICRDYIRLHPERFPPVGK